MAATAAEIARLRVMIGEATNATYTDVMLAAYIERYPLPDETGNEPRVPSDTEYYVLMDNPDWVATYDLNAAASDLWAEKAGGVSGAYDVSADGQSYHRSQMYDQYMRQSRYYAARRAVRSIRPHPQPRPRNDELLDFQ